MTRQAPNRLQSSRLVSTIFLDDWFAEQMQPRLRSASALIRYCDDFAMLFANKEDAERVQAVLGKRLAKSGCNSTRPGPGWLTSGRWLSAWVRTTLPTTFTFLGFLHAEGQSDGVAANRQRSFGAQFATDTR
ncbi:MAG: hypothetical protein ACYDC8_17385 [Gammaproteobacteria bacterium]